MEREISALDYQAIHLQFEYPDTTEFSTFQEAVMPLEGRGFRISDRFDDGDVTSYRMVDIDTTLHEVVQYITALSPDSDTAHFFHERKIPHALVRRVYHLAGQQLSVYRYKEVDENMHSCNASIVSPEHGFLIGSSHPLGYVISQQSGDTVIQQLIAAIRLDSSFLFCDDSPHHHHH